MPVRLEIKLGITNQKLAGIWAKTTTEMKRDIGKIRYGGSRQWAIDEKLRKFRLRRVSYRAQVGAIRLSLWLEREAV